jgi:acetyl-CoA carboxylase carboxyl transferase alpha subunit
VTERLRAKAWAMLLLDPEAECLDGDSLTGNPLHWPGYEAARDDAPGDEAVRSWAGRVEGTAVVLIAFDFAHLGGSMGSGVGARVVRAFAEAARRRLPVVTVTATGGARMQEGMVSLAQMTRTTLAAQAHRAAGLLQLAVATDPTTGGVYVSFAAQADLVVAEAGAYVAFAGPRVAASMGGSEAAADGNRAEAAFAHGLVDAVVARDDLRAWIARALRATSAAVPVPVAPEPVEAAGGGSAWQRVLDARADARPRASAYLTHFTELTRLSGDRAGGVDDGVICALGRLHGRPLGLIALDRTPVTPAGYRTAWRLIETAGRLGLPVLTLVDTPGATPAPEAERAGQAHAIARTFDRLLAAPVPTVCVVTGEGGSGGALALASTDRLLMQRGAVFSVIAPEGAAAILHRDPDRAPEVAELLQPTAERLVALGIADALVPDDPAGALAHAAAALDDLAAIESSALPAQRRARWLAVGGGFDA